MNKEERKILFQQHFDLSDDDMKYLWKLFMDYGHPNGVDKHRSAANHYFLQGLSQYFSVEWKSWKKGMTVQLRDIIKNKFPQLMVQNKTFEWN